MPIWKVFGDSSASSAGEKLPYWKLFGIVSNMATNEYPDFPTADQARDALREAEAAESATQYPIYPAWFFPLMSVLTFGLVMSFLPERSGTNLFPLYYSWAMIGLALWAQHRTGVLSPKMDGAWLGFFVFATCFFLAFGGGMIAHRVIGEAWVLVLTAVVVTAIVVVTGRLYQNAARRAAR